MATPESSEALPANPAGTTASKRLARGANLFEDFAAHLPNFQVETVFDIGANAGQSAEQYLAGFPDARIYCCEPVSDTFERLQETFRHSDRVSCFRLAIGASRGVQKMLCRVKSMQSCLLALSHDDGVEADARIEDVQVETLDQFCQEQEIHRINFLKIDTEGGDLDVLRGAEGMLNAGAIDMVQVEAGMNRNNQAHVAFEALNGYLQSKNYFLFGIYQQIGEWPTEEPHLRRTDPVFISERMIALHRRQ